jgi:hypothetical protein
MIVNSLLIGFCPDFTSGQKIFYNVYRKKKRKILSGKIFPIKLAVNETELNPPAGLGRIE